MYSIEKKILLRLLFDAQFFCSENQSKIRYRSTVVSLLKIKTTQTSDQSVTGMLNIKIRDNMNLRKRSICRPCYQFRN